MVNKHNRPITNRTRPIGKQVSFESKLLMHSFRIKSMLVKWFYWFLNLAIGVVCWRNSKILRARNFVTQRNWILCILRQLFLKVRVQQVPWVDSFCFGKPLLQHFFSSLRILEKRTRKMMSAKPKLEHNLSIQPQIQCHLVLRTGFTLFTLTGSFEETSRRADNLAANASTLIFED